jgi:hypothetical protein
VSPLFKALGARLLAATGCVAGAAYRTRTRIAWKPRWIASQLESRVVG